MDLLFIVSKSYVHTDEIINAAKEIAVQQAITLSVESEPGYTILQFFKDLDSRNGYFEIALYDEQRFIHSKKDNDFAGGYGSNGSINFYYDDIYLFPALKLLLNKIPGLMIYSEFGNASPNKPFVFSKDHFNVAQDLYSLNQPPVK